MAFHLREYIKPDFEEPRFCTAPDAKTAAVTIDGVAPDGFHAMSIFPEYFKLGGRWLLAEESRMDCVPVYENGRVQVKEFRLLKKGETVILGRTEDGSEGIFASGPMRTTDGNSLRSARSVRARQPSLGITMNCMKSCITTASTGKSYGLPDRLLRLTMMLEKRSPS